MGTVRINYKTSPFVKRPFLACAICEEVVPRRSNSQKYCDECRQLATSKKVAAYYKRHKKKILKQKATYRAENRDTINAKQRQYHVDTKLERPTRAMLREMKEMDHGRDAHAS
jgi:hypothetical protein